MKKQQPTWKRWVNIFLIGSLAVGNVAPVIGASKSRTSRFVDSWASTTTSPPRVRPIKAVPVEVTILDTEDNAEIPMPGSFSDPWNLFDRDTSNSFMPPVSGPVRLRVDLGESKRIDALKVFGGANGYLSVFRMDADETLPIEGLFNLDLHGLSGRWHRFEPEQPVEVETIVIQWEATSSSQGLAELELWTEAPVAPQLAGASLADHIQAGTIPADSQIIPGTPAHHFLGGEATAVIAMDEEEAEAGTFNFEISSDPRTFSRAFLVYELEGLPHWSAAVRRINGYPKKGGFNAAPASVQGLQVEEINSRWLNRGDNEIKFDAIPGEEPAPYVVHNLRLVTIPDTGQQIIEGASSRAEGNTESAKSLVDDNFKTGWGSLRGHSLSKGADLSTPYEADFIFVRPTQIHEVEVAVTNRPSGTLMVEALLSDGSVVVAREPVALETLVPGWNSFAVDDMLPHATGLRFTWHPKVGSRGMLTEINVTGSHVGNPSDAPELVVSFPLHGESVERDAYMRGFLFPVMNASGVADFFVDGAYLPSALSLEDGAFGILVPKESGPFRYQPDTDPWAVELKAVYPDGSTIIRTVQLNGQVSDVSEPTSESAESEESSQKTPSGESSDDEGLIEDEGAPFEAVIEPGKPYTLTYEGAVLEIPAGAVTKTVKITIRPLTAEDLPQLDDGMDNVTGQPHRGYRFGPHGIKFKRPIKVGLPYDQALVPEGFLEEDIRTFFYQEGSGKWVTLEKSSHTKSETDPRPISRRSGEKSPNPVVSEEDYHELTAVTDGDTGQKKVVSFTNHFTDMINATLTVPDHTTPLSFNPNSIKDIKVANPSAGITLIEPPVGDSSGAARLSYRVEVPPGRRGMEPDLAVSYSSEAQNGWLGWGWDLQVPSITVDTRFGVPRYTSDKETETYLLNGQMLAPVAIPHAPVARQPDKSFTLRVEGAFHRVIRKGSSPSTYTWEVTDKDGTRWLYGTSAASRLSSPSGTPNTFQWFLEKVVDTHGNTVTYSYAHDDIGSNEPSKQIYVSHIDYTGNEDGFPARYRVTFIRDTGNRLDQVVSGRPGFKTLLRHRLDRIDVTFDGSLVRRYRFIYQLGDYDKSLLAAIAMDGASGQEFYRHAFEYFEAPKAGSDYDGFAASQSWGNVGSSDGLSRTESRGRGANLFVGVGPTSCQPHVGVGVAYNTGDDRTKKAFMDFTGDGLPDRLEDSGTFEENDLINHATGNFTKGSFSGTSLLGFGKNKTLTYQAAVHLDGLATGGLEYAYTHGEEELSIADINGDGFPDIVDTRSGFKVRLNDGGSFTPETNWAGWDLSGIDFTDDEEKTDVMNDFHRKNTLLKWTAPYSGEVSIMGAISKIQTGGDGVEAFIVHDTQEIFRAVLTDADPVCTPGLSNSCTGSGLIRTVAAGDNIYFLTDSIADTFADALQWNPIISYQCVTPLSGIGPCVAVSAEERALKEPYGSAVYDFDSAQDFRLAGPPATGWRASLEGEITIDAPWMKTSSSENVTLVVRKNGFAISGIPDVFLAATDISSGNTFTSGFAVQPDDIITFEVLADTPFDPNTITWHPRVIYTTVCVEDPETETPTCGAPQCAPDPITGEQECVISGDPTEATFDLRDLDVAVAPFYPIFTYDTHDPTEAWVAEEAEAVTASWTVAGSPTEDMVVLIQGVNRLYAKEVLSSSNSTVNLNVPVTVTAGDQIIFTLHSAKGIGGVTIGTPTITKTGPPPSGVEIINVNYNTRILLDLEAFPEVLSGGFHRWHYGDWNGEEVFDESLLVPPASSSSSQSNFTHALPMPDGIEGVNGPLWFGSGHDTYLKAGEVKPSRLGTNVVPLLTGQGLSVIRKHIGKTRAASISIVGAGGNLSEGWTKGQIDLFDVNGDRFPDQVSAGAVRFNNGISGFGSAEGISGLGNLRFSEDRSVSFSVGSGLPKQIAAAVGKGGGKGGGSSNSRSFKPGATASVGGSYGVSSSQVDFIDVNGDGLPDHVSQSGGAFVVRLNLGYRFGNPETWTLPTWQVSDVSNDPSSLLSTSSNVIRVQETVGLTAGFGVGVSDFNGGVGFGYSSSRGITDFVDINGDGLPDQLMKRDGETFYRVKLNRGGSFGPEIRFTAPGWGFTPGDKFTKSLFGGNDTLSFNGSVSSNGHFGAQFCIPIPLTPVAIVIEPSVMASKGKGSMQIGLEDVDGDGKMDAVLKENGSSQVRVKLNKAGKTNLLKRVVRPLGGSFDVDYKRQGNIVDYSIASQKVDMPQNQWALASVTLHDGRPVSEEGVHSYTTTYDYFDSGFHDRSEREDYGYERVRENRPDGSTVERVYHNQDYFRKGLVRQTITRDAAGNLFLNETVEYDVRPAGVGAAFPAAVTRSRLFYEGTTTSLAGVGKFTSETFDYDASGNVIRFTDFGEVGSGDDVFGTIDYFISPVPHITKPALMTVRDSSGKILRQRQGTYAPNTGDLLTLTSTLTGGKDPATGAPYTGTNNPQHALTYTSRGNMASIRDPRGYTISYEYDPTVETYITQTADSFGYSSKATYDLAGEGRSRRPTSIARS